ncbi:LysR family transcriptional regulator [Intestinibacillus massiliensis]|nr:LysR family transcriptional regulator [Intestinibacillus massiliensis]
MTVWHLKLFVDVAELGSISAAAAKNRVRQPSVSQKVAELEKHYGVLLFERLGNRLHITESGEKLLDMARDLVARFEFLEEFMEGEHHRTRLRVGATLTIGSSIFPRVMQAFRSQYPQVEVYGTTNNTAEICSKLMKNELDIALVEGRVKDLELISIPMLPDYLVLACGRGHPFFSQETVYSHELNGMEFAMREQGSGTRELFEQYAAEQRIAFRTVFEYNNFDAIRQAVSVNNCLAVVSARLFEDAARDGGVRLFRNEGADWDRTFNLVYHKNKLINATIERFCAVLEQFQHQRGTAGVRMYRLANR